MKRERSITRKTTRHIGELTPSGSVKADLRVLELLSDGRPGRVVVAARVTPTSRVSQQLALKHLQADTRAELGPLVEDLANDLHELRLQAAASRADTEPEDGTPYRATPEGLFCTKQTRDGPLTVQLTNWTARIVSDLVRDDGTETTRAIELEATLGAQSSRFLVSAAQFSAMTGWHMEHLGSSAIIYPGHNGAAHTLAAIQSLSERSKPQHIYTHTGWRSVDGAWCYLHAGGAIGPDGPVAGIRVELGTALEGYRLPEPPGGADRAAAVRASLRVLEVADDAITVPLLAACYRVVLGSIDCSEHFAGPTGVLKTTLAALAQQHFGPGLDAGHLPGSWSSTANALEGQAFTIQDALLVVDDFAPQGSVVEQHQLHGKADRLLRAQGNHQGRGRMRADGSLRPAKPPRGMILSTGEEIPRGQSLRARLWIVLLGPGDVDDGRLRECQRAADAGLFASAMAAYLRWLAPQMSDIRSGLRAAVGDLRDSVRSGAEHRRTPGVLADLAIGWQYYLTFSVEIGALTAVERDALWRRVMRALLHGGETQREHQAAGEPTERFRELLLAALTSGGAHVASIEGDRPARAEHWGWRKMGAEADPVWTPLGPRIGWTDDDSLYLNRDTALAVAQRLSRDTGDGLAISAQTLTKRLHERNKLKTVDQRGGKRHLLVRHTIEGDRLEVLHLDSGWLLSGERGPSGPSAPSAPNGEVEPLDHESTGKNGTLLWDTHDPNDLESGPPSAVVSVPQTSILMGQVAPASANGAPGPLGALAATNNGSSAHEFHTQGPGSRSVDVSIEVEEL